MKTPRHVTCVGPFALPRCSTPHPNAVGSSLCGGCIRIREWQDGYSTGREEGNAQGRALERASVVEYLTQERVWPVSVPLEYVHDAARAIERGEHVKEGE